MSEEKIYTDSCLCGGIRYEIHGEIGDVIQCHCKRCRKANGSAFATNAPIQKADFKIIQGEHLLKKFASTSTTHLFTAYKAEWDTICDGLPQYDERP